MQAAAEALAAAEWTRAEAQAEAQAAELASTMLKVLCGVMNESVIHIYTTHDPIGSYARVWLDTPQKSHPLHGAAPPFKTIEIHPIVRPLREDRGRGRELDVRSKSGIALSSSG